MSAKTMARCYSGSRLAAMPFLMPDATHSHSGAYRLTLKGGPNHFVHVGSHPRPLEGDPGAVSRFPAIRSPRRLKVALLERDPFEGSSKAAFSSNITPQCLVIEKPRRGVFGLFSS